VVAVFGATGGLPESCAPFPISLSISSPSLPLDDVSSSRGLFFGLKLEEDQFLRTNPLAFSNFVA